MTAVEWVKQNETRFKSRKACIAACCRALHCSVSQARRATSHMAVQATVQCKKPVQDNVMQGKIGRSLAEFKQQYDRDTIVPAKINAALKQLSNGWLYEVEFSKLAKVTLADIAAYRDRYAERYIVEVKEGRRIWTGSIRMTEELRKVI